MAQSLPQASDDPQTQSHYAAQIALSASLATTVRTLWPSLLPLDPPNVRRLTDALSVLLDAFSESAITLAVDHYETKRRNAGITRPLSIVRTPLPPRSKVEASVAWAVEPLKLPDMSADLVDIEAKILERVQAKVQKALADEARAQMVTAVEGDEEAVGFARIARPDACAWCLMLAFRSSTRTTERTNDREKFAYGGERHYGVYKSRKSAGQTPDGSAEINRFHTNCHCTVEPIFGAAFIPAQHVLDAERLYDEATTDAESGDRLNAFRRALAAQRAGRTTPLPEIAPIVTPANTAAIQNVLDRIGEAMTRAA